MQGLDGTVPLAPTVYLMHVACTRMGQAGEVGDVECMRVLEGEGGGIPKLIPNRVHGLPSAQPLPGRGQATRGPPGMAWQYGTARHVCIVPRTGTRDARMGVHMHGARGVGGELPPVKVVNQVSLERYEKKVSLAALSL